MTMDTTAAGGLTVTAAFVDGVVVDGTLDVRSGSSPEFPAGRTAWVSGANA